MRFLFRRKLLILLALAAAFLTTGLHLFYHKNTTDVQSDSGLFNRWQAHKKFLMDLVTSTAIVSPTVRYDDGQPTTQTDKMSGQRFIFGSDNERWPIPKLPGLENYLPHMNNSKRWLLPEFKISKGRTNVTFVIGIPSIKRPVDIYIINTLDSLIRGMNDTEKDETLLIVCITEPWNKTYEMKIIQDIMQNFSQEIESGLLDIITPLAAYYPDLSQIKPNLNDPPERVKWRSKQNLDYAYLMLHSWKRGKYYLQLEDDIQASPGYITGMKRAIRGNYGNWFLLQFSTLGFIGRLFHSQDVPKVMEFLLMFFASKPCDWLLDDLLRVKMCGHGDIWAYCIHKIRSVARSITPSLFQHEGFHSSFSGNINKLKDSHFGPDGKKTFSNPPLAGIVTNLQAYSKYDIYAMYNGDDFYWASSPKAGDVIDFLFDHPFPLAKILIKSGNDEHPGDIIRESTVEILPEQFVTDGNTTRNIRPLSEQEALADRRKFDYLPHVVTKDSYHTLGTFNSDGSFNMEIPEKFGKVLILRISFHSNSETWVIINKIELHPR